MLPHGLLIGIPVEHAASVFQIGRLTFDLSSRTAQVDGLLLRLTGKELAVLELLIFHRGTTVTKYMFLDYLYAASAHEPEPKIIDVLVCKLRKKLIEATGGHNYIQTIWRQGYMLRSEEVLGFVATVPSTTVGLLAG